MPLPGFPVPPAPTTTQSFNSTPAPKAPQQADGQPMTSMAPPLPPMTTNNQAATAAPTPPAFAQAAPPAPTPPAPQTPAAPQQTAAPVPPPAPQAAAPVPPPAPQAQPTPPPAPASTAPQAPAMDVGQQVLEATTNLPAVPQQTSMQPSSQHAPQGMQTMSMKEAAAQDGFEGLDFDGFGVFQIIKLDQGEFQATDGRNLGQEFDCVFISSRPKTLYKTDHPYKHPLAEVAYTYDNETTTSGIPLQSVLNSWKEKGFGVAAEVTRYIEVTASLAETGEIVILNVSQYSIKALSAYWALLRARGISAKEVTTRVYRGRKVENVKMPFYPWAFRLAD